MCWLGGEVTAVSSIATADDGFRNTVVSFAGGAIGRHTISTRSHTSSWQLTVDATEGSVHADFHTGRVSRLRGDRSWSRGRSSTSTPRTNR